MNIIYAMVVMKIGFIIESLMMACGRVTVSFPNSWLVLGARFLEREITDGR
jgi:hypothetical protein